MGRSSKPGILARLERKGAIYLGTIYAIPRQRLVATSKTVSGGRVLFPAIVHDWFICRDLPLVFVF